MSDHEYYANLIKWFWDNVYPPGLSANGKLKFVNSMRNYEKGPYKYCLYYWMNGVRLEVIINDSERQALIKKAHINSHGIHLNAEGILYRLATEFKVHWTTTKTDVEIYLGTKCKMCQTLQNDAKNVEEIKLNRTKNWNKLIVEIIGPVSLSNRGKRYICILVDSESRWIEAAPLENYSVEEVGKFLQVSFSEFGSGIIYCVGLDEDFALQLDINLKKRLVNPPENLLSNITEVERILHHEENDENSIENTFGIGFSNALDFYIANIYKHVNTHSKYWDSELRCFLHSNFNVKKWLDLGYTPFFAMYSSNVSEAMNLPKQLKCQNVDSKKEIDYNPLDYFKLDF